MKKFNKQIRINRDLENLKIRYYKVSKVMLCEFEIKLIELTEEFRKKVEKILRGIK